MATTRCRVLVRPWTGPHALVRGPPASPAGVDADRPGAPSSPSTAGDPPHHELALIGRVTGTVTRADGAPVGQISGAATGRAWSARHHERAGRLRLRLRAAELAEPHRHASAPGPGWPVISSRSPSRPSVTGGRRPGDGGPPGTIGRRRSPTTAPATGIRVPLRVAYHKVGTGLHRGPARTDADGRFAVGGLGEGGFVLAVPRRPGWVPPDVATAARSSLVDAPPLTPRAGATLVARRGAHPGRRPVPAPGAPCSRGW